jgi:hypothetical protein
MDGEITFHDWHPANIQEYGIAAPDPSDPDMVYGSARTNVSLYNRKTGQTTNVGPSAVQRGTDFNRNVRTMPIIWSPVDHRTLFYTSNAVWKSTDHAHSWTRISPDLARATWDVPASAGKYASSVTPAPLGAITALSPSPRSLAVIWAGTDDGTIQVTVDGGLKWTNVTPPQIKPWTRIFNIEAGHFDTRTAYAAANTLRIDDMNPHFWRTHDGGKSWTEINTGVVPGAVVSSIREDPRKPGLLYGASDTQVWVSFDDGNHWESLRLNMPAISVRDLQVKDDSACLCSDLVAGTLTPGAKGGARSPLNFDSITATYTITNGVVRTDDLVYVARDVRVTGAGTYGLVDGRTAMDVTVTQGTNRVKAHLAGGPGALSIVPTDVRLKEPKDLKKALDRLLRMAVGYDVAALSTVDPATNLWTSCFVSGFTRGRRKIRQSASI